MADNRRALGDSVFVAPHGDGVVLTTAEGLAPSHTIYLNRATIENLIAYAADLFKVKITIDPYVESNNQVRIEN